MVEVITLIVILVLVLVVISTRNNNYRGGRKRSIYPSRRQFYEEPSDGEDFEELIEHKLSKLEQAGAKVIRNCYLHWSNGTTTQIDDILIFRSGIYVIECKDYSVSVISSAKYPT